MTVRADAPWIALALALCLVPVYAMEADVGRDQQADVVDSSSAYVGETRHDAVLNASNGYKDVALTVTHQHVDDGALRVWVNNTASDPRFTFPDDPASLAAGASGDVTIEDTDTSHTTGSFLVDARIEAQIETDAGALGRQSIERTLSVTVG